jgi:hypothetical protein
MPIAKSFSPIDSFLKAEAPLSVDLQNDGFSIPSKRSYER